MSFDAVVIGALRIDVLFPTDVQSKLELSEDLTITSLNCLSYALSCKKEK